MHCVKIVQILNFSGRYFPAFGLNTEIYGVNIFSPNAGKQGPEKLCIWKLFTQCCHRWKLRAFVNSSLACNLLVTNRSLIKPRDQFENIIDQRKLTRRYFHSLVSKLREISTKCQFTRCRNWIYQIIFIILQNKEPVKLEDQLSFLSPVLKWL